MIELDTGFAVLGATVVLAGLARGLAGFGTGMITAPVAAALYDPATAVVVIVIMDSLPAVPLTVPVFRIVRWREVVPVLAGMALGVPLGVQILKRGDETALRWFICLAILACVVVLWRGWRYRGPRGAPVSLAVGGVSGVLSGVASLPGPPVIVYWLAAGLSAATVRANLLALFLLGEGLSAANLWFAGLFERDRVMLGVAMAPIYLLGLLAGWRLYGFASDAVYRRLAFALVVAAALLALPAAERLFAPLAGL